MDEKGAIEFYVEVGAEFFLRLFNSDLIDTFTVYQSAYSLQ